MIIEKASRNLRSFLRSRLPHVRETGVNKFWDYKKQKSLHHLMKTFKRSRPDSNRSRRFCRPVPSRSATRPYRGRKNSNFSNIITKFQSQ